jgi:predicted enzyme related to lactoylglutathione lyase
MTNPVNSFEIPVSDLDRAVHFYEAVFGYALERAEVDGNEFAWFPVDNDAPGISGALAKGESYTPSTAGTRIYFSVENIDATLAKVHAAGGKTMYPKTSVGELGYVAEFKDCDGNRIALHMRSNDHA